MTDTLHFPILQRRFSFSLCALLCTMLYALCPSGSLAAVRYVSHSGSNTPPYLTWETAADSIMSAINISSFGDTIYVANGVYKEQVVMIPGLSLIGAGMDSCVIDTRNLVTSQDYRSVQVADSCLLTGFQILVYNNSSWGRGIAAINENTKSWIYNNKVISGFNGFYENNLSFSHSKIVVYNNLFTAVTRGIYIFNSDATICKNLIYTDPNSQASSTTCIHIEAFDYSYKPIIDSNLIYANRVHPYSPLTYGINQTYGGKPIITNNIIFMGPYYVSGISLGYSDTINVWNNLIFGKGDGINNRNIQYLKIYNNYIGGNIGKGIIAGSVYNDLRNNVITGADIGIEGWYDFPPPITQYNNLWNNGMNYHYFTGDSTNLSENPMVINDDSTQGDLDFHLQAFSPIIDRGDPNILDKDSSRSDIGLYGGPFGESYRYLDLPPRTPVNFTAVLDTEYIKLSWNRNTESDLSNYNLYRDTMQGFPIDSTTFVASIEDTFYLQTIPPGIDNFFFRVTAVDNQGNESEPSEERHIEIVAVKDRPKIFSSYQLYQNYPNPFNPSTKIGYRLKDRGYVKLYVYDIKGELVSTLVNKYQEMGYYEVEFYPEIRGQKSEVNSLASGIYIYQIMIRNERDIPVFSDIKKMILLK